jgi:hypothetical protein
LITIYNNSSTSESVDERLPRKYLHLNMRRSIRASHGADRASSILQKSWMTFVGQANIVSYCFHSYLLLISKLSQHVKAYSFIFNMILYPIACCSILISIWVTFGTDLPPSKAKLMLLSLNYGLLLPITMWIFYRDYYKKEVVKEEKDDRHFVDSLLCLKPYYLYILYLLLLLPLAYFTRNGVYSADESTYLFQARAWNHGGLWITPPAGFSDTDLMYSHHLVLGDKWFGKYPPGWPLVLSLGTFLNIPWIVNPLLGLLSLILCVKLLQEMFPENSKSAQAPYLLLLVLSPFFTLSFLGFMSHGISTALTLLALLCFLRGAKNKSPLYYTGTNVCLCGLFLVRPFTAVCIAACFIIFSFYFLLIQKRKMTFFFISGILWGVIAVGALLFTHKLLTGDSFLSPYAAYNKKADMNEISVSLSDILHTALSLTPRRIADTLFVILPILVPLSLWTLYSKRKDWRVWLACSFIISLVTGYIMQPEDADWPVGERYYFEGFFGVPLLAAFGFSAIASQKTLLSKTPRLLFFIGVGCVITWIYTAHYIYTLRIPYHKAASTAYAIIKSEQLLERGAQGKKAIIFLNRSADFLPLTQNLNRKEWLEKGIVFLSTTLDYTLTDTPDNNRKEELREKFKDSDLYEVSSK